VPPARSAMPTIAAGVEELPVRGSCAAAAWALRGSVAVPPLFTPSSTMPCWPSTDCVVAVPGASVVLVVVDGTVVVSAAVVDVVGEVVVVSSVVVVASVVDVVVVVVVVHGRECALALAASGPVIATTTATEKPAAAMRRRARPSRRWAEDARCGAEIMWTFRRGASGLKCFFHNVSTTKERAGRGDDGGRPRNVVDGD
jgi:hypothetical protein